MLHRLSRASGAIVAVSVLGALCGCAGASATTGVASESAATAIRVVASTDVYGDIAQQIGGDRISVTSIIDDANKDPHEYQASGQNQLAISKAHIVIENGAGYDDFVDTMLASAKNSDAVVINAAALSGYGQQPGEVNEHFWYDVPTVAKIAAALSDELSRLDPADAATFSARAATFAAGLATLTSTESEMKSSAAGKGVLITEPVPLYMLDAIGLVNRTPAAFSEAVENDSDVAPDVLATTTGLLTDHQVVALVYNSQTGSAQTELVLEAARSAGIPEVPVTETLPSGMSYLTWMTQNLAALKGAVS